MKTLLWVAGLALLSVAGNAGTVYIVSDALDTPNDSGSPTVDLNGTPYAPNGGWGAALPNTDWISYGPTGDPGSLPFLAVPNGTIVTFTTRFVVSGSIIDAILTVMADDTTAVVLNGSTLFSANLIPGPFCAPASIGCITSTEGVFTYAALAPYLVDGTNTLSFVVRQLNGGGFGVDFGGEVVTADPNATPEPASLAFIAGGLIALAILRRR